MSVRNFTRLIRANLIAGVLTLIPLAVVWLVLDFLFGLLVSVGSPFGRGLSKFVANRVPGAAPIVNNELVQWFAAVILALVLLYLTGAIASRVIGKQLIGFIEGLIARIPLIETVYSASKQLISMLQQKPDGQARVVLVEFPQAGMKVIGLVTRVFTDAVTGDEMATVYVPTAVNPTAGFLEIVPLRTLTPTDLTMDQAMTMIVSGGAVAPENFSVAARRGPTH